MIVQQEETSFVTANIGNIGAQDVRGTSEHQCRAQPVLDRGLQPIPQIGENRDGAHQCRQLPALEISPHSHYMGASP
jgi:hypothetical protein